MIDSTIKYLVQRLKDSGLFASVHGIVDMVEEASANGGQPMRFPAFYVGKDSARFIASYDFRTGVAFFMRGRTNTSTETGKRACATFMRDNQRPVLYIITRRDRSDTIQQLTGHLIKALTVRSTPEAREQTGAAIINGSPVGFETDPETVLRDIFANIDIPHRLDLAFMRVDLSYDHYSYVECLTPSCP